MNKTKEVNKHLTAIYGKTLAGLPIFRVVFSNDLLEKRIGTFADWYGKIFIREWTGIRDCPKYGYIEAKYILERWIPPAYTFDPMLPDSSQGSYEPIYVFQDAQGKALPVNEEFIHRVIWQLFHPDLPGHRQSVLRTQEDEAKRKEIQEFEDIIENESPYIAGKLHGDKFGKAEAIVVPSNYIGT